MLGLRRLWDPDRPWIMQERTWVITSPPGLTAALCGCTQPMSAVHSAVLPGNPTSAGPRAQAGSAGLSLPFVPCNLLKWCHTVL